MGRFRPKCGAVLSIPLSIPATSRTGMTGMKRWVPPEMSGGRARGTRTRAPHTHPHPRKVGGYRYSCARLPLDKSFTRSGSGRSSPTRTPIPARSAVREEVEAARARGWRWPRKPGSAQVGADLPLRVESGRRRGPCGRRTEAGRTMAWVDLARSRLRPRPRWADIGGPATCSPAPALPPRQRPPTWWVQAMTCGRSSVPMVREHGRGADGQPWWWCEVVWGGACGACGGEVEGGLGMDLDLQLGPSLGGLGRSGAGGQGARGVGPGQGGVGGNRAAGPIHGAGSPLTQIHANSGGVCASEVGTGTPPCGRIGVPRGSPVPSAVLLRGGLVRIDETLYIPGQAVPVPPERTTENE